MYIFSHTSAKQSLFSYFYRLRVSAFEREEAEAVWGVGGAGVESTFLHCVDFSNDISVPQGV